jgi:hypothetical protein
MAIHFFKITPSPQKIKASMEGGGGRNKQNFKLAQRMGIQPQCIACHTNDDLEL